MARSKQQIQTSIFNDIASDPILSTELTSLSATAIWRLWVNVMSNAILTEEQINDKFLNDSEALIASNPPANTPWIRKKIFEFQYSATAPQALQLDTTNLVYYYPTVDTSLNIITRASITSAYISNSGSLVGRPGVVQIKVAKGSVATQLAPLELSALQTYLNIIAPAGLVYVALSAPSDRLFTEVKIYYNGLYSSVIKANVYSAYINYLANIPFDSLFKISDLDLVLRQVEGVVDIDVVNCNYRAYTMSFDATNCNMIKDQTQLSRDSTGKSLAGYVNDENTSGYDFLTINDSNFISA